MRSASATTQHIVMSPSGAGVLRAALRLAGRRERVAGLADALAMGPIDPLSPSARLRWGVEQLGFSRSDWAWLPGHVSDFWRRVRAPAARRIVWASSRSANEWCALLAAIERAGGAALELIDLADVEVGGTDRDGRPRRRKALSLGMLNPETVAREQLWERAAPIADRERVGYVETWRRLRSENAPLRLIGPEGLKSAPLSAFDAQLLSHATPEWRRAGRVIGGVLADGGGLFFQAGDLVLAGRIAALVEAGRLESRPSQVARPGQAAAFGLAGLRSETEVRRPAGAAR